MGKIENDEQRKIKNAHFIRAFEYVAQRKEMNQTQLATAIGSKTAYISVYRNGTRPVPEETIDALIRISATIEKGKGQIYKPYLLGLSDYMLRRNVPQDELADEEQRRNDPDYDLIKERRKSVQNRTEQSHLDESSMINAMLAAKDQLIVELQNKYIAMEREKAARIAEVKQLAEERLHRISELRRVIDSHNISMTDYPFPIGAAEK
jgi:transcriptional regulator with XRE-family HTH domain